MKMTIETKFYYNDLVKDITTGAVGRVNGIKFFKDDERIKYLVAWQDRTVTWMLPSELCLNVKNL